VTQKTFISHFSRHFLPTSSLNLCKTLCVGGTNSS
jgi:hypothetical protein